MRLRLLAIPAVLGLLLAAAGFLRADDKQLPLRVWLFRLPGTELGLDVAEMNGDTAQDLVAAHMTSPSSAGLDRSVSVYYQGPKGERFRGEADRRYRVPADACAFVAGDFDPAPGGEVVFICPTRVVLVRGRNELVRVAAIDGFFDYPENHGLPVWTMAWDLDGDALPELIVPTKEGYALFKRTGLEAPLAEVSRLKVPVSIKFGPAFETQLLNRFLSTSSRLRRLVAVDLDRDGRKDLVAYRDKGLARFLQRPDGTFPERPDREEPVELVQGNKGSEKKDESTEAFANVRLSLADVDGDGRADLLATRTVGELGVFETLRTQQLVFRGTDEGGWDESKPDVILNFKGISDDPVLLDWDGDGKQDLIMSSYRMDMFTNVKRALTDSMTITYMIFRQGDGEGLLPDEPSFSIDAEVPLSVLERRGGIRAMLFTADLNGDKVRDMVARRADGGLKVVLGLIDDGEPGFDEDNPIRLGVGRTNPPWVRDLDGDGKDELLLEPFGGADLGARTVRVVGVGSMSLLTRRRVALLAVFAGLLSLGGQETPAQDDAQAFLRIDLQIGGRITEVLTPDIDGDGKLDLLVVRGREALIFLQNADGTWPTAPGQRFRFHPRTVLFDVGDLDGDKTAEVALLQKKGVFAYKLRERGGRLLYGLRPEKVALCENFFNRPVRKEVRRKQFLRDADADGDLDLVLPRKDGFSILRNEGEGRFAEPRTLVAPPTAILNLGRARLSSQLFASYWFANPNVAQFDATGGPEVVLAREGEVFVFGAKSEGELPLESRGSYIIPEQQQFSMQVENPLDMDFTLPLLIRDLDKDGRVDVSTTHVGKGTTRIYRNREPAAADAFKTPAVSVRAKGITFLSYYCDMDGDGLEDLILPRMDKVTAWSLIKVFITREVPIEMLVFYQQKDGFFPGEPDDTRELEIPVSLNTGGEKIKLGSTVVATVDGDYDGDKVKDLLYRTGSDTLSIFRGIPKKGVEQDASLEVEVRDVDDYRFALPTIADLDQDGRHDVIMRYWSWDREGDQISLLISRWAKR